MSNPRIWHMVDMRDHFYAEGPQPTDSAEQTFQVIEKSAYDELQRKLAAAKGVLEMVNQHHKNENGPSFDHCIEAVEHVLARLEPSRPTLEEMREMTAKMDEEGFGLD